MIVNIVTNHINGAGLQKDSDLLTRILEGRGHQVNKIQFNTAACNFKRADVNFFLEVINPYILQMAPVNVIVPNSEWWGGGWDAHLPRFRWVLCKTDDCLRIWTRKLGAAKCRLVGWEAPDYGDESFEKQLKFFHGAGKSETKNTAAVIEAWRNSAIPYPLTVSAFKPNIKALCKGVKNVTLVERFAGADMPRVMNEHFCHVMPSKYEGYGMAIHEALSCQSLVITTDAPPMHSFSGIPREFCVQVIRREAVRAAHFYHVNPLDLTRKVHAAAQLTLEQRATIGKAARAGYLKDREHFRKHLPAALAEMRL